MSYRKKNSANTFPPRVSLLLSLIRKEDEKSQHKNGKIAVTDAIFFLILESLFIYVIHAFGVHPTI